MNKAKEILDKNVTEHVDFGAYGRMVKMADAMKAVEEALNQVKNNVVLGDVMAIESKSGNELFEDGK